MSFIFNVMPPQGKMPDGSSFLPDIALAFIAFSTGEFFRLDTLKNITERYEGYGNSIREVMKADANLTSVFHADYNGILKVQGSLEMMGCGKIVVEDGGKLIVDGRTLSNVDIILTPGAFLQILNGGVIETINGFSAPIGATID